MTPPPSPLDYAALIDALDDDAAPSTFAPPVDTPSPSRFEAPPVDDTAEFEAAPTLASEFVVEANGTVRQAGAAQADTPRIGRVKARAERSLYFFAKAVLGRAYLSPTLHKPVCDFLLDFATTRRRGLLLPRECAKTTLVSHALPLHIQIQPKEGNVYVPGESGREQRIVLACETQARGKDHLEVQRSTWQRNGLLRALWPACVWEKATRDAPRWNNIEYDLPRDGNWPDPSVRTIGVDGAITGAHPSVLVKDDLVSVEAANSPVVMASAIEWHRASRALINGPTCLEFIIGTRWAVYDLYADIMQHDPSVVWYVKQLIEDGACIYPPPFGPFSPTKIVELQNTFGPLFMLLYMNSAADPSLTDFDLTRVRRFHLDGEGGMVFDGDARDTLLATTAGPRAPRDAGTTVTREHAGRSLAAVLAEAAGPRDARRLAHLAASRAVVT